MNFEQSIHNTTSRTGSQQIPREDQIKIKSIVWVLKGYTLKTMLRKEHEWPWNLMWHVLKCILNNKYSTVH